MDENELLEIINALVSTRGEEGPPVWMQYTSSCKLRCIYCRAVAEGLVLRVPEFPHKEGCPVPNAWSIAMEYRAERAGFK